MSVQLGGTSRSPGRSSHYLVPLLLVAVFAAVIGVVETIPAPLVSRGRHATGVRHATPRVPPYYFVRPGDTLLEISLKTGLSVNQLEAFNPNVDPENLLLGERLNLWRHPPAPRPPPPKPMFWTVQPGQSFGSIAAKTGVNLATLEALNPRLGSTTLQPGERVRLRRGR